MKSRCYRALLVAACGWLFLSCPLSAQIVLDTLWSRTTLAPMELCTWNFFCRTLSAIGPNSSLYMLARDDISHSHLLAYDSLGNTLMDQDLSALGMALEVMVVDRDGNVYIAGREYASYPYTIKIVKYGPAPREYVYPVPDGAAHFPSSGDYAAINGMVLDNDGNVYIVGYQCTSYDSEQYRHNMDMVVAKFTPDLDLVWCDIYDSGPTSRNLRGDLGLEICRGENNSVFVVGAVLIAEDPVDPNNLWDTDIIVRKYNADGLVWSHTWGKYGQWGEELPTDMSADNQGNVYIGTESWHNDIYSRYYSYSVLRCAESGVDELLNQVFDYGSGGPWPADPYYRVSLGDDSTVYVIADDSAGAYTSVSSYNSAMTENWSIPLALGEFYVGEDASFYYSSYNPPVLYKNDRNNALLGSIALNPRMFVNLEVDRANQCAYAVGSYHDTGVGHTVYKLFRIGEKKRFLTIHDAHRDSIPNVNFDLIRVTNNPPYFDEDTLGSFTTDSEGRLSLTPISPDSFFVQLDLTGDTLVVGNSLKIAKHVHSIPAVKHQALLGTMYSVYLDNMQFADNGQVFFDTLTADNQDIILNHTELRYNLLASVEWEATDTYLWSLENNFKKMSDFLYDVSDGQIRLDTVYILDNSDFSSEADVLILASNMEWPRAHAGGILRNGIDYLYMPRIWIGDSTRARNHTDAVYPLDLTNPSTDYRTKVHEFGHYALNFYDEYLFWHPDSNLYSPNNDLRCLSPTVFRYGFMDSQYEDGREMSSEMSGAFRYNMETCRNTNQWLVHNKSCWDHLESWVEAVPWGTDNLFVPILKPDLQDTLERVVANPAVFFAGPNNDLNNLDYDAGIMVHFPNQILPQAVGYSNKHVTVHHSTGGDNADIRLWNNPNAGAPLERVLEQGRSSDASGAWVVGVKDASYQILASKGNSLGTVTLSPALASAQQVTTGWLYGIAESGGSGVSRVGNSFSANSADDSITIALNEVQGYYPLIGKATLTADGAMCDITTTQSFPSEPTLELWPSYGGSYGQSVNLSGSGYSATVSDSLGESGSFALWANDDSSQTFFVPNKYTATAVNHDQSFIWLFGAEGQSEFKLDSANTSLDRVIILSSPYPVIRTGLGENAVQAGQTHCLSVYPDNPLTGSNQVVIRYDDADLKLGDQYLGDEATLSAYRWVDATTGWILIGGTVDTVQNAIYAPITQTGVYAAFTTQIITDVEDDEYGDNLPYRFELSQNYPNPFNPVTTIQYSLPERSHVLIEVYNVLGQKVQTLVDREESAGSYTITWSGTSSSGQPVSTGVYLYRFQTGDYVEIKKMLLLK